jgi:predicted DNA-binding transcriptional regulator AlpA
MNATEPLCGAVPADEAAELVFTEEVLRLARCSESTLKRWIKRDLFPVPLPNYPGRRLVWARSAVSAWLESLR